MHTAALHGHASAVKILLEHGADCTIVDSEDRTCLDIAIGYGFEDVATVIVNHPGYSIQNYVIILQKN